MGRVVSVTAHRGHAGASPATSEARMRCCSSGVYCAVSVITQSQHDLAELLTGGKSLVRLARSLEGIDGIDGRHERSLGQRGHDRIELAIVSHGGSHDRPLMPEQLP